MSEQFPQVGFNPIVEFKAQETGVDVDKVALFFSILHEEMNSLNERVMTRALTEGLTMEEITKLAVSMLQTTGIDQATADMVIMEDRKE